MASYYKHTATLSREVPYSFQCEHCMKDSGPLTATISSDEATHNSLHKTLSEQEKAKLNDFAYKNLQQKIRITYKDATSKQIFGLDFKDSCPHCQQPQSWSISGMKDDVKSTLLAILAVGLVVSGGVYLTQGRNLMLFLAFLGVFAVAAAGFFVFKSITMGAKKKKVASALQQNLPTIDWSPVQDLIGETSKNV